MNRLAPLLLLVLCTSVLGQGLVYHCSSRVIPPAGPSRDNSVYIVDAASSTVISVYPQFGAASGDAWGYRDGCTDANGDVYFGWGGGVVRHGPDGMNPVQIITGAAPGGVGTWRALAYDPNGNGGAGSIWCASFGSALIETDLAGNLLQPPIPNPPTPGNWSLYGLSYDDTDGNLWGHHTGGAIIKIDVTPASPTFGTILPGVGCPAPVAGWTSFSSNGGLSGFSELGGAGFLAALGQGTPDELMGVDVSTACAAPWFPPINMNAIGDPTGHLGVAVTFRTTPALKLSQPLGPGTAIDIDNAYLTPGLEYFNLFTVGDPAPGYPGTGNFLGLQASNPVTMNFLATQIFFPPGIVPFFHNIAAAPTATYPGVALVPPGVLVEGVVIEATPISILVGNYLRYDPL